jgi:uncharacterized DUF497 family protein
MRIVYDPAKRQKTLEEHNLDFEDAPRVFAGRHFSKTDLRIDYGETRIITVGQLDEIVVVLVWTLRGNARRIISMRKADAEERGIYRKQLD